ncbi:MAG: hypothetical protein ACR2QR_04210 [Woeseiaceae bacterium]
MEIEAFFHYPARWYQIASTTVGCDKQLVSLGGMRDQLPRPENRRLDDYVLINKNTGGSSDTGRKIRKVMK